MVIVHVTGAFHSDFGAGTSFDLDGPATVTLPSLGTTLVAQRSIRGVSSCRTSASARCWRDSSAAQAAA